MSTFEEVTEWLRENHRMRVTPTYANAGEWQCSCGAENGPGTRLTCAQARANADRHLRAARAKFPACRYCQREARQGDICDSCWSDAQAERG